MNIQILGQKLIIKSKNQISLVPLSDIYFLESMNGQIELVTQKRRIKIRESLKNLEIILPENFIRMHRSFIINQNLITDLKLIKNDIYEAIFENGEYALVSKTSISKLIHTGLE